MIVNDIRKITQKELDKGSANPYKQTQYDQTQTCVTKGAQSMQIIQQLSNGSVLSSRAPSLAPQNITAGSYFTHDGKVARVRKSRSTDRLYAELFNESVMKFEYARGLVYNLSQRMTLEEARAWGTRLGHCCVCGAKLTDNRSVDAGIGPICIKKL